MLKFNITGDKLFLKIEEGRDNLNSGSKGYYTAEFTFDSDWDGLIPHITITENGTPRADEVIVGNRFEIPTTESGIMQIGVYGLDSNGKKCISSNFVCLEVKPGAYTGVTPLPKDIWDGYQITVLGYVERAEGAAADAKKSADSIKKLSATAVEGEEVSVVQSESEDGGIKLDFTLPRGPRGYKGEKGDTGPKGDAGEIGPKGEKGDAGEDGKDGVNGKDGINGVDGKNGYSPVRGTDYWTPEDIAEIKNYVDEAILGGAW